MDLHLSKASLHGTVSAVSAKSSVHRLMICSALSNSPTFIDYSGDSSDISATIQCITALGCHVSPTSSGVLISPNADHSRNVHLDCLECGSTLRFLLPVAAALNDEFSITGHGRLTSRPLRDLAEEMEAHGCILSSQTLPLCAHGRLKSGAYHIPGNISSQYISGLMFALPLLDGNSEIVLTTPLSSAPYVEMTLQALEHFGIDISKTNSGWSIRGSQKYISPERISADGDWSSAAYWLCAGAVSGPITVTGLRNDSEQADSAILSILRSMGAAVSVAADSITVSMEKLLPLSVDVDQYPDLMPTIAITLAMCPGESLIYNAARLRLKESDRISAVASALTALGVYVEEGLDYLRIKGGTLYPGTVNGANDHRVVMASALASVNVPVTITGSEAVDKSYPCYFNDLSSLGGKITHK